MKKLSEMEQESVKNSAVNSLLESFGNELDELISKHLEGAGELKAELGDKLDNLLKNKSIK